MPPAQSQTPPDLPNHSSTSFNDDTDDVHVDLSCPQCQYNLIGTTSDRCPSCGWDIDVDELAAYCASSQSRSASRWSIVVSNVVCISVTLLGANAMLSAGNKLSLLDACLLLSVLIAIAGHLCLGISAITSVPHWPMKQGEISAIITFVACVSIALGIAGATQGLGYAPTPLVNDEGYQVNGPLEFVMIATLATLPAWTLLILRLIAYRPKHRITKNTTTHQDSPTMTRSPFTIAILQSYDATKIKCQWQDTPQIFSDSTNEHISNNWDVLQRQAQKNRRQLYNGELIRLVTAQSHSDTLQLTLAPTCYKHFVGTNLCPTYHDIPKEPTRFAHALGISVVLSTKDGYIVLGLRNDTVMYHAEWIHTIGGMLEAKDKSQHQVDIIGCGLRELNEELLVKKKECQPLSVIGLASDTSIKQPELILTTQLLITRRDIENRFDTNALEQEHTKLIFVPDTPDEIIPFICRSPQLTPIAQAALIMHGYHHWGQEWFEQTCLLLYDSLPQSIDWHA